MIITGIDYYQVDSDSINIWFKRGEGGGNKKEKSAAIQMDQISSTLYLSWSFFSLKKKKGLLFIKEIIN